MLKKLPFYRPKRIPEANIQAELYCALKKIGCKVILEYKYYNSRFDAVVLDNSEKYILAIIEVKSKIRNTNINTRGAQYKKYNSFGVPVIYCINYEGIPQTVEKIKKIIDKKIYTNET